MQRSTGEAPDRFQVSACPLLAPGSPWALLTSGSPWPLLAPSGSSWPLLAPSQADHVIPITYEKAGKHRQPALDHL
jgi:hypothetical protein